jgi:hypothetical protein
MRQTNPRTLNLPQREVLHAPRLSEDTTKGRQASANAAEQAMHHVKVAVSAATSDSGNSVRGA